MELIINKEKLNVFYGSDFHADFWKQGIQPFTDRVDIDKFDLFLLAGDIGEWEEWSGNCLAIYEHLLKAGKIVVMIPGNHEFYSGNYQRVMDDLAEYAKLNDNFYFLERNFIDLPVQQIRIWGDTFWTDFRGDQQAMLVAKRFMNDYRQIYFQRSRGGVHLEPEDTVILNDKAKRELKGCASWLPEGWKLLVMTHHAPFPESTPKQYRAPDYTDKGKLNKAYANDLFGWCYTMNVCPDVWIHGHIHERANYEVDFDGKICRVISNPFGYPGEKDHDEISRHYLELSKNKILTV